MNRPSPPQWMEHILLLTLPSRNRESIAGDLHEEYEAVRLPQSGRVRADLWYARHVLSFMPQHVSFVFANNPTLTVLCGFTGLCGLWLGAMGFRLRHSNFVEGEIISLIIMLQAALTIVALCFRPVAFVRRTAVCGTLLLAWLAWKALVGTLRGAHFEGYILLIATLLLVQALMTLRSLPDWHATAPK